MLRFCRLVSRLRPSILVAAILAVVACSGSSSKADEVTVYKIQNRWNQFIYDAGEKVGYDKGGDGAKHRWVLEETPDGQRIKNFATGAYVAAAKDVPEVKLISPTRIGAPDKASLWTMDVVSGSWLSIKSCATGKYLTCEAQRGVVDCDGANVPTSQTWWLSQWEFVHVGGPNPPKRYRLHKIAVSSPEYCSDVAGDTTVTLVAPGFKRLTVKCWKQGGGLGSDSTIATVDLDAKGNGSFVFPAKSYPHGPVTVRISGENDTAKDNCYLQLYNKGGELEGKRYLSESAVRQLTSRQTPPELKNSYGFGFGVGPTSFGHGGAYSTNTTAHTQRGLILVWLVQHAGFPGEGKNSQEAFRRAAFDTFAPAGK